MPSDIRKYGIQSGGPHVELVVMWSTAASRISVHDFQAKRLQKASPITSTAIWRAAFTRFESSDETASMPTWPRIDCTKALARKVAPTSRNTAVSSCQSVEALRK